MTNRKNHLLIKCLSLILSFVFLYGCMPADSARTSDVNDSNVDSEENGSFDNTDADSAISLKQDSQLTQNTLLIDQTNNGNFVIQGETIDQFISSNLSNEYCIALSFPGTNHIFLASAVKQSFFNFSTSKQEFVWLINPLDSALNSAKCSNPSVLSQAASTYGVAGALPIYRVDQVCPSCSSRTSNPIKLFANSGALVTTLPFVNHRVQITTEGGNGSSGSLSCNNGSGCPTGQCCITNQCVLNGQVKPNVDQNSTAYLAAVQNILAGLDTYANNQEYFFVCSNGTGNGNGNTGGTTGNPAHDAQVAIDKLGEILACTQGDLDEQGICTIRYENAKNLINPDNLAIAPGADFLARVDDLNFSGVNPAIPTITNNIVEIIYGGERLYHITDQVLDPLSGSINPVTGDDVSVAQSVNIKANLSQEALDSTLIIKYKADVSCKKQGSSFTQCTKYYNMGQLSIPARPSDHTVLSTNFLLPYYANVTTYQSAVILKVDGSIVPRGATTWQWDGANPFQINFIQPLFSGQKLTITYFVQTAYINDVVTSANIAQTAINDFCNPGNNSDVTLVPVYTEQNGAQVITGYNCQYSQDNGIPAEQVVDMSSKNTPHLYYDEGGILKEESEIASSLPQEGLKFEYIGGNYLKPNNQDANPAIGFNEIYGSFRSSGSTALPAKKVNVKSGKLYVITTQEGSYSPCPSCGNDYYSNLVRMFPQNFSYKGGGTRPDVNIASHQVPYTSIRSDDFKFGRACFVPATMIPWTHKQGTNVTQQRRDRLKAQHFLFANGYKRDWYGFDYGSLIGSFDGITWFSIGNQRKITAKTGNLYLAINGYFADVANANNIKVRVSEVLSAIGSDIPDHDSETDGAECQKSHFCQTDNDCLTQLGYDYTCVGVNDIHTTWPTFNIQGREAVGKRDIRLTTLLGGTNGQNKRCVYRGAGSLCSLSVNAPSGTSPYSSGTSALHACSTNSHCTQLATPTFNDRIARYARPALAQNSSTDIPTDTDLLGLGARILGRPYDYRGTKSVDPTVVSNLTSLNALAVCTPGRRAQAGGAIDFESQHLQVPGIYEHAKITNTGSTPNNAVAFYPSYLSSCPTIDSEGNYFHSQALSLNNPDLVQASIRQNLPSNLLLHGDYTGLNIFNDNTQPLPTTEKGIRKNTCLRAPGASCFTDLECAPNSLVGVKARNGATGLLNPAEIDFWKEDLICAQKESPRSIINILNPEYKLTENRCCREVGKSLTIYSNDHLAPTFNSEQVAGVDLAIQANTRYSRIPTIYDRVKLNISSDFSDENNVYKGFRKPSPDPAVLSLMPIAEVLGSYKDFHEVATRTCCGGNWVRNFHEDNGGGHTWAASKMQTIDKKNLKSLSWSPLVEGAPSCAVGINGYCDITDFACTPDNVNNQDCSVVNLDAEQEKIYLNFLSSLELIGIPQISIDPVKPMIEVRDDGTGTKVLTNILDPVADPGYNEFSQFIPETLDELSPREFSPELGSSYTELYSASQDSANFNDKIKNVFAEKDFTCCQANGEETSTANTCCSGTSATLGNNATQQVCCLPDYSNVSVYMNRYVSSEAAEFSESLIDQRTGYFKDPAVAVQKAASMCCSKSAQFGVAVFPLSVPGAELDPTAGTRRFLYRENESLPQNLTNPPPGFQNGPVPAFNNGQKWNNQIYCVPPGAGGGTSGGSTATGT